MARIASGMITVADLNDGVGIASMKISYARSSDGVTPPTDGWSGDISEQMIGNSDGVFAWGTDGTILTVSVPNAEGIPVLTDDEPYLWTRIIYTYTDGTQSDPVYSVSKKGKDGRGIASADVVYYVGRSNTTTPDYGTEWKTLFSQLTLVEGRYVWSATLMTYTDGTKTLTGKQCLGACEEFADVKEQYALSTSATTAPTSGWGDTYTAKKGYYLWSRSLITYTDGTTSTTTPVCTGYFGTDGEKGSSVTLKGVALDYVDGTNTPDDIYLTSWDEVLEWQFCPKIVAGGTYLFVASMQTGDGAYGPTVIQYADKSTTSYTESYPNAGDCYIMGDTATLGKAGHMYTTSGESHTYWEDMGQWKGDKGDPGNDGDSVYVEDYDVYYATSDSGTTAPDDGWELTVPTITAGKFLWTKTVTRFSDGDEMTTYSVSYIGKDGSSVTIKGTLSSTSLLPTSGNTMGDGYIIDGDLWVYTASTAEGSVNGFTNVGQIKGDKGDEGESALMFDLSTDTITLETGDDGIVTDFSNAKSVLVVRKKGQILPSMTIGTIKQKYTAEIDSTTNCGATIGNETAGWIGKNITITSVDTEEVTLSDGTTTTVSKTNGSVIVKVTYNSAIYYVTLRFQVNVSKFMGKVEYDVKGLKTEFTEVSKKVDDNYTTITNEYQSAISQTAQEINASVTSVKTTADGTVEALTKAGFSMSDGTFHVEADKFIVSTGDGEKSLIVEDGSLNADLMKLTHLYAKSTTGTIYGHFGYCNDDTNATNYPLWVGAEAPENAGFRVDKDGKAYMTGATLGGTLNGVDGSFTQLTDPQGNCKIGFQNNGFFFEGYTRFYDDVMHDGKVTLQGGDLLSSNIKCRGALGSYQRAAVVISGSNIKIYYQGYGTDTKNVYVSKTMMSRTVNGVTTYSIPLYMNQSIRGTNWLTDSEASLLAGMAVDLILLNGNTAGYHYEFVNMQSMKTVMVVNTASGKTQYIACQDKSIWYGVLGGTMIDFCYIGSELRTDSNTNAGAGVMVGGSHTLSYT